MTDGRTAGDARPGGAESGTERVALTPAAAELLVKLTGHPRSADVPPVRRLLRRQRPDVLPGRRLQARRLGRAPRRPDRRRAGEPIGFCMSESQFEYWKHTHLTVDVVKGRGSGFSVEAPRASGS